MDRKTPGIASSFLPISSRKEKKEIKEENEIDHKMFSGNQIQDDQNNSVSVDKLENTLRMSVFLGMG